MDIFRRRVHTHRWYLVCVRFSGCCDCWLAGGIAVLYFGKRLSVLCPCLPLPRQKTTRKCANELTIVLPLRPLPLHEFQYVCYFLIFTLHTHIKTYSHTPKTQQIKPYPTCSSREFRCGSVANVYRPPNTSLLAFSSTLGT